MPFRRIDARLALLLAAAALVPLVLFGASSMATLQRDTRASIVSSQLGIATREAEQLARDLGDRARLLNAIASDLTEAGTGLPQQALRLRNVIQQFRELRELTLFDAGGRVLVTSHVGQGRAAPPALSTIIVGGASIAPPHLHDERLATEFMVPLVTDGQTGFLVADVSLDDASDVVRRIRSGTSGHAMLVDQSGRLLAHSNGDLEHGFIEGAQVEDHPLLGSSQPTWAEYSDGRGEQLLGVVAAVPAIGWRLILERPAAEVFATPRQLQRQLLLAIITALALTLIAGGIAGRRFAAPIVRLERATQALAAGDFRARVSVNGTDEINRLASSFNTMADRLVELQNDVKSQDRQVMFARVVGGLFHDLTHPVQNIANNARLLLRPELDEETRTSVRRTIERELVTLRRFMDDVLHVARPRPLERFPVDVNATLAEVVDAMRIEWERSGVIVSCRCAAGVAMIEGDRFALGRVYRNLLANAIQATPSSGQVQVTTAHAGAAIEIRVSDTGPGIPADRLSTIFDDFVTTRRRGLGLGLATSRRIVEQLGGTISVDSEVGTGTTFTLRFPASAAAVIEAAS